MDYTDTEKEKFASIRDYIQSLRDFLNKNSLPPNTDITGQFAYSGQIKAITGNPANWQSFLSVMLAKKWLLQHYEIKDFDAGDKHENTRGLDIDIVTLDGKRIIGEIKTSVPVGQTNFGAKQKEMIHKDFQKLNDANADYKFFFMTDGRAYQYVTTKYREEIPQVKVVLLIDATEQESK